MSLRALIILVLVLGGGFGWVAHRAQTQRKAVAAIKRAGGTVAYDWTWKNGMYDPIGSRSPWPNWLLDHVGPDYFHSVKFVSAGGQPRRGNDALMVHIGRLADLECLSLNGCKDVTDRGLVHLRGLTELRVLDVSFTGATGRFLSNLSG
jgi:hypothetical protein